MSRRKHTIRREAGLHLTDRQREMLGTAWNQYVNSSRRYVIEHVSHISQDDVITAIKRMKRRNALRVTRSVTTDNGCEFLDQERLDSVFRSETYYTRAYASYEKGAIETAYAYDSRLAQMA